MSVVAAGSTGRTAGAAGHGRSEPYAPRRGSPRNGAAGSAEDAAFARYRLSNAATRRRPRLTRVCPMTDAITDTDSQLRVDRPSEGVVLLTLANPDQRNAMSGPMTEAWAATIAELAADRELRAVVVTGEGTAFCSGGDPRWIA